MKSKLIKGFTLLISATLIIFFILIQAEYIQYYAIERFIHNQVDEIECKIEKYKYEKVNRVSLKSILTLEEIKQYEILIEKIKNENLHIMHSSKVTIPVQKLILEEFTLRNQPNDSIRRANILNSYAEKLDDSSFDFFKKIDMNKYMEAYTEKEFEQKLAERKAELLQQK